MVASLPCHACLCCRFGLRCRLFLAGVAAACTTEDAARSAALEGRSADDTLTLTLTLLLACLPVCALLLFPTSPPRFP
jgi:hypothetical protein